MSMNSGFALWRGGSSERIVATAFVTAWFISRLVYNYGDWVDPQWSVLVVDGVLLLILVVLGMYRRPPWLLFAAAFQLIAVAIHGAVMADHRLRALTYVNALAIWSYLTQAALFVGVLAHIHEDRSRATGPAGFQA